MLLMTQWPFARAVTSMVAFAAVMTSSPAMAQMDSEWVYRVAPSRPQIQTLWQPPALPMGERDVIDIAGRLGLTREQTIAFESLLPEYLQQACALRRGAIKSIAGEGVFDWGAMRDAPPKQTVQKSVDARLAYERALATLDSAIFDRLESLLAAEQQSRLPAERLRRERNRLLTDDVMISVCGEGPLLTDLGAVVETLNLPADQRDAARSLVATYESQATARLHALFEASVKEGIQFAEAMSATDPTGNARTQVTQDRFARLRKTIEFEEQFVDQIAAVLGPDAATTFRLSHAQAIPDRYGRGGMDSYMDAMTQAIASTDDIDVSIKEKASALQAQAASARIETLPELSHLTRIMNIYNPTWRPGGMPMMMTSEIWQGMQPLQQRQEELSQKTRQAYMDLDEFLRKSTTPEQFQAIRKAAGIIYEQREQASGRPARDYYKGLLFGGSNIVTMVSMSGEVMVMSADAQQRRSSAMKRLGLDEDATAVAVAAVDDALDRWSESAADVQRRFAPLMRYGGEREAFDAAAHEKATAEALSALESMRTLVPAAVESLAVVIDDPSMREHAITALLWSDIADPPLNCPAPMDVVRTSHYRTVTTMLDRVDPSATLLALNLPAEATAAAWQVMRDEAGAGEQRVWSMRKRVAEALAVASRSMQWQQSMMMQHRDNPREVDWSSYAAMQRAATEACRQAQQARREHLAALALLHQRVAEALPEDQRARYLEAIERAALPDAWIGVDRARRMVDLAITAPEVTDQQREQAQAALAQQQEPLRENARAIAGQITELSDADDMTAESWPRRAPMYALFEQLAFERDQEVDAMLRLLRPVLSAEQMQHVTTVASAP